MTLQNYTRWNFITIKIKNTEYITIYIPYDRINTIFATSNHPPVRKLFFMDSLDRTDLLILAAMQENSRLTTKELAARVHLSTTPVFERLRRLEREGYIKKYVAVLDADKLNRGFIVFCNIKLHRMSRDIATGFANRIAEIPEVTECYNISGRFDYMLKIHAPDMRYYQQFILNVLGTIESLDSLESTFVMDTVKNRYGIPF